MSYQYTIWRDRYGEHTITPGPTPPAFPDGRLCNPSAVIVHTFEAVDWRDALSYGRHWLRWRNKPAPQAKAGRKAP